MTGLPWLLRDGSRDTSLQLAGSRIARLVAPYGLSSSQAGRLRSLVLGFFLIGHAPDADAALFFDRSLETPLRLLRFDEVVRRG
jgi:hypothetical protein